MVRQAILTIAQSIRASKVWFSLLGIGADGLRWNFWMVPQGELTALGEQFNLQELMNWPAPYTRSTAALKIFLKALECYTSRENFEGAIDRWLNLPAVPAVPDDEAGGELGLERTTLIDLVPTCENSSITAMIFKCREMLESIEYFDSKIDLGKRLEVQGIENKVIREEQTKELALKEIDEVLEEQEL